MGLSATTLQFNDGANNVTYQAVTAPTKQGSSTVTNKINHLQVASALPSSPDYNTIYFII